MFSQNCNYFDQTERFGAVRSSPGRLIAEDQGQVNGCERSQNLEEDDNAEDDFAWCSSCVGDDSLGG